MSFSLFSAQWFLIQAQLPVRHSGIHAELIYQDHHQLQCLPLSVTHKGRLFEVVRLSAGQQPLRVDIHVDGQRTDEPVQIQTLSVAQAYYWMWHRVAFMWHIMPASLRRRMGFMSALKHSFYHGYRLLSSFRYHYPAPDYAQWLARYWQLQPSHKKAIQRFKARLPRHTNYSVVIDGRSASAIEIEQSLASVRAQEGFACEPLIWRQQVPEITTHYVLHMKAGCVLRPWAVAWFVWQQQQQPELDCIYSDHDHHTTQGEMKTPYFKPDWSLELQYSTAYVGEVVWVKKTAYEENRRYYAHDFSVYGLLLEIGAQASAQIGHIPALLWSAPSNRALMDANEQMQVLSTHLQRSGIQAEVQLHKPGIVRVRYAAPQPTPLVSIIIPTRDMLHFLQPCVESIVRLTQWQNYEIIIVDNQSGDPQTLAYFQQLVAQHPHVRVISYDYPFNYSAVNNFAVKQAKGSVICLLNNDTEVISPDWLEEMVSRLAQEKVGVVGARLYYADGRVQHAGDVVGVGGCATHLHGVLEQDDLGYMGRAMAAQDLSAVTAACLVTPKTLYEQLGGLNEEHLTVAFNDVDYCLRVREAGYNVVYTPYAELYHYESVSRGKDDDPVKKARAHAEANYMRKRWPVIHTGDPYYNPNLNGAQPDFSLSKVPRIDWPWS